MEKARKRTVIMAVLMHELLISDIHAEWGMYAHPVWYYQTDWGCQPGKDFLPHHKMRYLSLAKSKYFVKIMFDK